MEPGPETPLDRFGQLLARRLQTESSGYKPYTPSDPETLHRTLQPGDVLVLPYKTRILTIHFASTQLGWTLLRFAADLGITCVIAAGDENRAAEVMRTHAEVTRSAYHKWKEGHR
jgi:hypothetical protein